MNREEGTLRVVYGQLEVEHEVLPDVGLPPSDLPKELTSFIGREHEIAEVAH